MFADVIVDIQHEKLDKIFQYRIPEELESRLQPGMEVVVPFGKGNRQIKGYVTGFSEKCEYDLSKVKSILSISEKGMEIETRLIALAAWMKEHYGGTMIQSLKTVLPIRQKENAKVKKHLRLLLSEKEGEEKAVDLVFNEADKSWSVEANGESTKLLKFTGDDEVVMYLPDGKEMNVELNQAGVLAFKQVAEGYSFYAAR